MKQVLIFTLLMFALTGCSATSNYASESEYDDIGESYSSISERQKSSTDETSVNDVEDSADSEETSESEDVLISIPDPPSSQSQPEQSPPLVGRYIITQPVPQDVNDYARKQFSTFHVGELIYLGFTPEEAANAKLSPGFFVDGYEGDSKNYHFYVMSGNHIVAELMVHHGEDNSLSCQFGKGKLADALDSLRTTNQTPARIFVTSNAFYSADIYGNVQVLERFIPSSDEKIEGEILQLTNNASDVINGESIILLSADTVYPDTVLPGDMKEDLDISDS